MDHWDCTQCEKWVSLLHTVWDIERGWLIDVIRLCTDATSLWPAASVRLVPPPPSSLGTCLVFISPPCLPLPACAQHVSSAAIRCYPALGTTCLQRAALEPRFLRPLAKVWMQPGRDTGQCLAERLHQPSNGLHYWHMRGEGGRVWVARGRVCEGEDSDGGKGCVINLAALW